MNSIDSVELAKAFGDPVRARILDLLSGGRAGACCSPSNPGTPTALCACDLAPALGGMAPSRLAYHLGILRRAGLVEESRRGKWVYYTINRETIEAFRAALGERWLAKVRPRAPHRARR